MQGTEMGGWRRKRGQAGEEASGQIQHGLLPCSVPCFPLSYESESTFLALTLSYLDPSLFSVPGTVNLAVCCSNGPFQGGPFESAAGRLSEEPLQKGRHPGRESICQATKCPHVSRCLVHVCGCAQRGIQDPIVFCPLKLAEGLVARVGHNLLQLNMFSLSL